MASQGVHSPPVPRVAVDTPRTPADVRALFPAATTSTYLNAAASSPLSVPVERVLSEHLRETLERGDAGFVRWLQRKEAIRAELAAFIGGEPENLAFTPNTSMGFHAI